MRWPDEAIVGILWILAALQRLQIWHTLLASAKDHSSGWFLFDLCGRCWIGFGGLIGQGWIWNDMDECDMNVFMFYDFMIFLIFSSHIICTKTTIDHRLLELLPRFQWETPCTGQGWHCLRQWLKRVRPVRQLFNMDFLRLSSSTNNWDPNSQLRSQTPSSKFSRSHSWVQTAKMAIFGNARMSHTCHTCHTPLWGVSCSKTSSVFTFSQILRLSDPKNDSMKPVSMWRVEKCLHDACVYHIIHLADLAHAYDALVMCFGWQDFRLELILPTWLMNWPLFSIGKLLLSRKRCMWNKYNILATEPRPRKRRSFPPTRSQRELGGWK